jgi:hypothetical protein
VQEDSKEVIARETSGVRDAPTSRPYIPLVLKYTRPVLPTLLFFGGDKK